MEVLQAYRFKARPSRVQAELFDRTAGSCRLLYNLALEQRQRAYRQRRLSVSYSEQSRELRDLKAEFPFFREVPHHCLQVALQDVQAAFSRFFQGSASYPRFKKKGVRDSFTFPDKNQVELLQPVNGGRRGRIRLPKAGWLSFVQHRVIPGEVRRVTLSKEADGWYVSILTRREIKDPKPLTGEPVGGDLGVVNALTLSTGEVFQVPSFTPGEAKRLKRLQQKLARQVKGSRSRAITKRMIAGLHQRVAARRLDALHKISHRLTTRHSCIALEALQVKNMTRSAKGTVGLPGVNVRQKAGLNRGILAGSWGELRRQVAYKAPWNGSHLVLVKDFAFSSQQCCNCGFTHSGNRTSQASFKCLSCGAVLNADVNAAKNILARGLRVTAGGAFDVGQAVKPEFRSVTNPGSPPEASPFRAG